MTYGEKIVCHHAVHSYSCEIYCFKLNFNISKLVYYLAYIWQGHLTVLTYFMFQRTLSVLVTFYQWEHFVIIKSHPRSILNESDLISSGLTSSNGNRSSCFSWDHLFPSSFPWSFSTPRKRHENKVDHFWVKIRARDPAQHRYVVSAQFLYASFRVPFYLLVLFLFI